MTGPRKVEIISLNDEDAIDMIVEKMQYSNGKDSQVATEIIERGDKTTNIAISAGFRHIHYQI